MPDNTEARPVPPTNRDVPRDDEAVVAESVTAWLRLLRWHRIFQALVETDEPLNVTELCDRTDLGTNIVSHHLQCLRNCQLVDAERDGRKKYYEVSRSEAVEMLGLADDCIRQNVESVLGCEIVTDTEGDD